MAEDTADLQIKPSPDEWLPMYEMDEFIVTALRGIGQAFDLPYTVSAIDEEEFHQRMYRTLPEALRYTTGVLVQQTGHGQGSPYIRGFTGYQTLMLIDGIRLNNSVFRSGPNQYWNTVDPMSIASMEVVKGPASVLYGSDAVGGVVNVLTRSPSRVEEGSDLGGRLYYRYASAGNDSLLRGEVDAAINPGLGVFGGVTGKWFNDLRGGRDVGRQNYTGYDEYDVDFKVRYDLNDNVELVAAHQRVRINDAPRTHRTVFGIDWEGLSVGSDLLRQFDQERELTYLQLHATELEGVAQEAHLSVSWHEQSEVRHRVTGSNSLRYQGFDVGTFGLFATLVSETPVGKLTYGLEYYRDEVNSFSNRSTIQGPVADDASYDLLGLFVQNQFDITDKLHVTLGGRFTYAHLDADRVQDPITNLPFSMDEDWSAFVGSARLVADIVPEQWHWFGGISQAFRAPNLSDTTRFDTARTNEYEIPVTGLDPEYYLTFETGIKAKQNRWEGQLAYFYTMIDDMIIRFPTGVVDDNGTPLDSSDDLFEVTKGNVGDGYVQGIELELTFYPVDHWKLFGNLTWMIGEVDTFPTSTSPLTREYLDRLMPLTVNLGARHDLVSLNGWVEGIVTIAGDADKLSTRDASDTSRIPPGGTPGYVVLSLRSGWQLHDKVELTFALENLTDEDYRVHGSGLNEPGLQAVIGLEVSF